MAILTPKRLHILSVNEDQNHVDRISAIIGYSIREPIMKISVTDDSCLQISYYKENSKVFIEMDELIGFLSEAKTFVSESRLFNKLKGKS